MSTTKAFRISVAVEALCWFAGVGDVRIIMLYGLAVYGSLKVLYHAKELKNARR